MTYNPKFPVDYLINETVRSASFIGIIQYMKNNKINFCNVNAIQKNFETQKYEKIDGMKANQINGTYELDKNSIIRKK